MLHKRKVMLALYYAARRRLRLALRIPALVHQPPVLGQPLEQVVARHGLIARFLQRHLPVELDLAGKTVCEIGAGDCLAAASLFLGKGAAHVDIIEVEPPVINEKQLRVLECLQKEGLPIDLSIIRSHGGLHLTDKRVSYHRSYMEQLHLQNVHDLVFSFSVIEHVEDLAAFYASCWKTLRPGGWMLHLVDLSGHSLLEDPVPPLDFQTYPDWLYDLMLPPYNRATRRFFNEHLSAVVNAGFKISQAVPTRNADPAYLDQIWPALRPAARLRPREEIQVLEFICLARKF